MEAEYNHKAFALWNPKPQVCQAIDMDLPNATKDSKSDTWALSMTACRAALLAEPTEREAVRRCTDGRLGCC